jgi:hypothetical protein
MRWQFTLPYGARKPTVYRSIGKSRDGEGMFQRSYTRFDPTRHSRFKFVDSCQEEELERRGPMDRGDPMDLALAFSRFAAGTGEWRCWPKRIFEMTAHTGE